LSAWNFLRSRTHGVPAGPNPWGAASLEWLTTSPPEPFNFARIPLVDSRDPLWDGEYKAGPTLEAARLTPLTSGVEGEPGATVALPEGNVWSVGITIGMLVGFAALLARLDLLAVVGLGLTLLCLARWMWPTSARVAGVEA